MSTTPPPPGPPPSRPPYGPPSGPPSGPTTPPPGAEVLEHGRGGPMPPAPPRPARGGRRWWWAGAGVAAAALIGAGAYGVWWYTSTGPQPAEALPAGTAVYLGLDLDPSGEQKLDALSTMKKFPALADELGLRGDVGDIDVAEKLVELISDGTDCASLDYAEDVEPWLGDRIAIAGVDLGEDEPVPVFALQVSDGDAAQDGIATLDECGGVSGTTDASGTVVTGDWMLVAETQEIADQVAEQTEQGSLADDEAYRKWTDAAGGSGVLSLYVGPSAADLFADLVGDDLDEDLLGEDTGAELDALLEDFDGMAASLRFDDGALELEVATGPGVAALADVQGDTGADAMTSLPDDTLAALGIGFEDGWFQSILDYAAEQAGEDADELLAQAESATGLELPEDAETLAGRSAVLAIGPGFDLDEILGGGFEDLPVALKVLGDTDAIEDVVERLRESAGAPEGALEPRTGDGSVTAGLGEDWSEEVAGDGGLGDSDRFRDVIREADRAASVFYLDLDGLLTALGDLTDDEEIQENLEPLAALGVTSWLEDGVGHSVLRLTTD